MSQPDFPKRVQIQTTVACGAACAMCPHPTRSPEWKNGQMDDALYTSIVDQLRGRDVEYVAPYLMADPLSDKKIFDRIRQLRAALPGTTIEISTTGKYLVPVIATKLIDAPLSELRISSHGISAEEYAQTMPGVNFEKAMANIKCFIAAWKSRQPYPLKIVSMWGLWPREREQEIEAFWNDLGVEVTKWRVTSRAGQADLSPFSNGSPDPTLWGEGRHEPPYLCRHHRDTEWIHILSDGRIALCCMDYGQEVILGDVREGSIEAIWNGDAYRVIRAKIRGDLPMAKRFLCRRCEWHVSQRIYDRQTERNEIARREADVLLSLFP